MNKYTSIIKTIETALLVLRYGHSTKKDTIDYIENIIYLYRNKKKLGEDNGK